ncbi:MAG TPA: hypothetical protein VLJ37_03815 [bacterium]|nr:hypothetical protein [bacterium]
MDSKPAARIGLGVKIDDEGPFLRRRDRGGKINGGRGLAHTTLLIAKSNNYSHLHLNFSQNRPVETVKARKMFHVKQNLRGTTGALFPSDTFGTEGAVSRRPSYENETYLAPPPSSRNYIDFCMQ